MTTKEKSIADLVKGSLAAFKTLLALATDAKSSPVVAAERWKDEGGRLRIWSANLGAHQTGSSSLTYRLRHAPSIEEEVIDTLDVVHEALKEAIDELRKSVTGNTDFDGEVVEELYKDVADSIGGLFRLSTAIRNPSRRDQVLGRSLIDKSFEAVDQNHVREMLPQALDFLIERLGRANSQRRANFRYLQRHHEKLAQGLDDDDDTKTRISGTVASDLVADHVDDKVDGDILSDAASVTSYAPSLFDESNVRRFPKMPEPTTIDGRFECPLCFYMIKASNTGHWRKHIFVDLQPYVCVYQACSQANKLFANRRDWFAHEVGYHIKSEESISQCHLCAQSLSTTDAERHLARHLEDLALFTLPSALFDDDNDKEIDSEAESDSQKPVLEEVVDNDSENSDSPDVLLVRHRDEGWSLEFPPFSLAERMVLVRHVRERVAARLGIPDGDEGRVGLIYRDKTLARNSHPVAAYGVKHNSEIRVILHPTARDLDPESDAEDEAGDVEGADSPNVQKSSMPASRPGDDVESALETQSVPIQKVQEDSSARIETALAELDVEKTLTESDYKQVEGAHQAAILAEGKQQEKESVPLGSFGLSSNNDFSGTFSGTVRRCLRCKQENTKCNRTLDPSRRTCDRCMKRGFQCSSGDFVPTMRRGPQEAIDRMNLIDHYSQSHQILASSPNDDSSSLANISPRSEVGRTTEGSHSAIREDQLPRQLQYDTSQSKENIQTEAPSDNSAIPPGARWTKMSRDLVSPEALEEAKEAYEEREEHVIVLRVLTKSEIQTLADRTTEIRGKSTST